MNAVKFGLVLLLTTTAFGVELADCHDPHILSQDDWFYVFSTGRRGHIIGSIRSQDLINWEPTPEIFKAVPEWIKKEIPRCRGLWAPDIHRIGDRYCLYYSASTFGSQRSFIGLATNKTLDPNSPDYAWTDQGNVIASDPNKDFNAIDAGIITAKDGRVWMTWGSYWRGIKLAELNPKTGKLLSDPPKIYSIAKREAGTTAIEGAYSTYRDGFYYLWVSFDTCCKGINSNYNIRLGRSKEITGPYADKDGKAMTDGGGTLILQTEGRWIGPGHNSVLTVGKQDYLVYHTYDAENRGRPILQIRPLEWDKDGWPTPGPILNKPVKPQLQ
jgi:arabinan endo-1,5-alpha-L-arabinosidase